MTGSARITDNESRTIRVYIGTLDIHHVYDVNPPGATELFQIAQSSAMEIKIRS